MSKLLRHLLEAQEPLFTQSIRELEQLTNKKGVDVALTAAIIEQTHVAVRSLGLDSNDTTDRELYAALQQRVHDHNAVLSIGIGLSPTAGGKQIASALLKTVKDSDVPLRAWVLKPAAAKNLLRAMPPKRLMKHLRYRSIESMFKNEKFHEVYAAIRFSEGDQWLQEFNQLFEESIQPSDFAYRSIELIVLDAKKWSTLAHPYTVRRLHPVVHAKEVGVIAIAPIEHVKGAVVRVLPLVLHYINEIRLYSTYFKLKSTDASFAKTVSDTLSTDRDTGGVIANFQIHWRIIQRHFSELEEPVELFQPHIQPEDLQWRKAEATLANIHPDLEYWTKLDYVGRIGDERVPVSFNLIDNAINYAYEMPFGSRVVRHMRESLWNELFVRYLGEDKVKRHILSKLDSGKIKPEEFL